MSSNKSGLVRDVLFIVLSGIAVMLIGAFVFREKRGAFVAAGLTVTGLAVAVAVFESSRLSPQKLTLTAVMTALSVLGRIVFYPVPFFKPVSAIVIICGISLGPVCGAVCGALSALVSGLFFGLGLWTPFQMLAWGVIGLVSGLFAPLLKKSRILTGTWAALSGIIFSLMMDVFTVLTFGEGATFSMYTAAVVTAIPVTAVYAVSNVAFLAVLARPVGRKLDRIIIRGSGLPESKDNR